MLTARRLQSLLLIPTLVSLCCVYLHISRQNRLINLAPRGDGETHVSAQRDRNIAQSVITKTNRWNSSPSQHARESVQSYKTQKGTNGLRTKTPLLTNSTVPNEEYSNTAVPTKGLPVNTTKNAVEILSSKNVSKDSDGFMMSNTSYSRYKFTDFEYNNISTQELLHVDLKASRSMDILRTTDCEAKLSHNQSNVVSNSNDEKCIPYYKALDVCTASERYYPAKGRHCKSQCQPQNNERLCYIVNYTRTSTFTKISLKCSMALCDETRVFVATVNSAYGVVTKQSSYSDVRSLENGVRKAIMKSLKHGFDYIFLSCESTNVGRNRTQQILFLPPLLEKLEKREDKPKQKKNLPRTVQPNINIVVLDSISRAHFPRVLPRTTRLLKEIAARQNGPTIADFKYFQSLAPFTFVNIKSFMAGKQKFSNLKKRDVGFREMFEKLHKSGYQTMVQEDTCWYDKWGSILTSNNKRERTLRSLREIGEGWKAFKRVIKRSNIDGVGLTHSSCYVLRKYKQTNMFNKGPSFCHDGKPLSAHLLRYASEVHKQQETNTGIKPQFTYTHINIAHESSGKRACAIDEHLAETMTELLSLSNTVTILWSDHGAKTTPYSIHTLPGKFETHDSFLLISLPRKIKKLLGGRLHDKFLENQHSVVSAVDLHHTVLFLSKLSKAKWPEKSTELGLFTNKTWKRGCDDIPMRDYSLCKCIDNYLFPDLSSWATYYDVLWMAEFAIGKLNNKLSSQIRKAKKRNCLWLQALGFRDAIIDKSTSPHSRRHIFDILINHRKIQVFNVQVKNSTSGLYLFHWQRTSIYQDFDSCRDSNASLELCICRKKGPKFDLQQTLTTNMFGSENNLDFPLTGNTCLMVLERNHQREVASFSIANLCDQPYNLHVSKPKYDGWEPSAKLPLNLTVSSKSITFILSARKRKKDSPSCRLKVRLA
ncbi:uncharacterized protein LOC135686973 [Rhopilema esculentum]|uniref:uncharacterized protein LOC135686973 n=1 Tax=Rhopilema esculentum TaxID=499914 RepID=UPI0031D544F2